uniref:Uncharacterized protein n=1 Tax=Meloidogyne enterolobii TaxID=390850 RepID=A0A6V7YAC4_MELEN|nr:unnamed protein product [Meloidogyne enterolobii]
MYSPIKFRNPVLCINSAIDVNNFENFLKKSPNEQQISPPPQNFENCSTEQPIFNTITTTPEYNTTTTTPQSYTQYNFSFWMIYTLLGLILILQLFYWFNIILRKIRRRRECKLIRKGATKFQEKTRGAPTPNTPIAHRRGSF